MAGKARSFFRVIVGMVVIISVSLGEKRVDSQVHHVIGGDHGWDRFSGAGAWASGRVYRVGDQIWFKYSAAQGSIAELENKEEFESCDVSNPIRMYTDGMDRVLLDGEGTRDFSSARPENCKNGLKLHVDVQPQPETKNQMVSIAAALDVADATGPTPSASSHLPRVASLFWVGLALLCFMTL